MAINYNWQYQQTAASGATKFAFRQCLISDCFLTKEFFFHCERLNIPIDNTKCVRIEIFSQIIK